MPTFIRPARVTVTGGGGGAATILAALAAVAAVAVIIWRWLAAPHMALELVLYAIFGVGLLSSAAAGAFVLRREFGGARDFRRELAPRIVLHATAAPVARPVSRPLPAPAVVYGAPQPQVIENHLHLHGITAEAITEAIAAHAARQPVTQPAYAQAAIEEK